MKTGHLKTVGGILLLMVTLQALLFGIQQLIFVFVERTDFSDHMAMMAAMALLTVAYTLIFRAQKVELSVFPKKFGTGYIIATTAAILLLIVNPVNYFGGAEAIWMNIFACIVTPIFEELIFRGYIWKKLNTVFTKEWKTYLVSTVLFGLWHLGYISSIAFRVETGLANAMMWKVIVGLCFGVVLGFVRLKTKNCYSTILLHGVMNLFGR
ncbi:MAG TPA: CPBP family intramembrane metalloprotease [Oscillospiraceae bacterium]|nr:CPBP family intramembrane metalloprotease [Oscillospiraceae bacterium]HPF55692.1 CPBP family intramembrane metalloprotease [Clostridiales bacterium]HPK35723.1 CPBP family intramembrane metalloprotease [Oscillospiraceae bacterium]HPR75069.1 CPBP family intramembrane metalloprotease [Oscillospiraceae bacterium]